LQRKAGRKIPRLISLFLLGGFAPSRAIADAGMKCLPPIALCLFLLAAPALAGDREEVAAATGEWERAVDARDAAKIASLYDHEAFLFATFQTRLDSPAGILSYFENLVEKDNLQVDFHRRDIRVFADNCAINSGLYTFSYTEKGKKVSVPARYTFVYLKENGAWKIIEHHSSVNPESH